MYYKKAIEELENHKQNISVRDGELLDAIDFAIGVMMEVDELKEKLRKYDGDTAIVGGKEVPIRY